MLIYLLRHGQTEYNAQKRYQGQRDIPFRRRAPEAAAGRFFPGNRLCDPAAAHFPDGAGVLSRSEAHAGGRAEGDELRPL